MIIESAILKAKAQEEEKVAISLKVSANTKSKLQKISDENQISLNNLCSSILESALDGKFDEQNTLSLVEQLNIAKTNLDQANKMINAGDEIVETTDGRIINFNVEKSISEAKVTALTSELKRR